MSTRKLGKYKIEERLGRGGMAEVYRAYHANLDRYVAIKVLHAFLAEDEEFSNRFAREAQNIARLKHPHIVQVYDYEYDEDSESYYMVMELVEGDTLKDRLISLERDHKRMSLEESLRITREAASALAYAHKVGMIHRDVKPANLILDQNDHDRVVLTDFGIAKIVTGAQHTLTGGLVGTPAYMAPEQGVGETGDERSDLYSLGVILYQMLIGQLPYDAETPLALILKHMNDPIPEVNIPGIPPQIDKIIRKLMAKEPSDRYESADELIADVRLVEEAIFGTNPNTDTPSNYPLISLADKVREEDIDSPTIPFSQLSRRKDETQRLPSDVIRTTRPPEPKTKKKAQGGGIWKTMIGFLFFLLLMGGGYALGASQGVFPAVGLLASKTPTETLSATSTEAPAVVLTDTPTDASIDTPTLDITETMTNTPSATPTETASDTPTGTPSPTITETESPSITPTLETPSATPNVTQTLAVERTATFAACTFDYAIIAQDPEDGEDGGFFTTNSRYTRTITFLNTGTCAWERNTSLTFLSGEDFNAGPRIFIREAVDIGAEVEVTFEGTLPSAGDPDLKPIAGQWQLRTPGQINIGEPFTISVLVYSPGS